MKKDELSDAAVSLKIPVMLDPGAYLPDKAYKSDAGFDIRIPNNNDCSVGRTLYKAASITVDTGVHMIIPGGFCGLLVSKSGLNVRNGITGTGLIDAGYTGSIKVKLYNQGYETYKFKPGDKLIQIMIIPVPAAELFLVDKLPDTERGKSGFGSSGR